ncbi:MAG: hypothetical protein HY706_01070 [Candidatus Hydrogenedentes bacterium]|nr:hypothetical protein [Candidatus Hydrogenedentota bacterium]
MALFGRGEKPGTAGSAAQPSGANPTMGRRAFCRICNDYRNFSKCWLRAVPLNRCMCCGTVFDSPAKFYQRSLPVCPKCGEYLEHPGFEYGVCDGCNSKFELVGGAKPGLLPNRKQREEMNRHGKAWSPD